jgi:hypothetical protein
VSSNLVLLSFPGSAETEIYLDARHREAARGKLIGCAGIFMYSHNDYAFAIKGEIRRSPTFTRGLLPELDFHLAQILRGK